MDCNNEIESGRNAEILEATVNDDGMSQMDCIDRMCLRFLNSIKKLSEDCPAYFDNNLHVNIEQKMGSARALTNAQSVKLWGGSSRLFLPPPVRPSSYATTNDASTLMLIGSCAVPLVLLLALFSILLLTQNKQPTLERRRFSR